MAEVRLDSAPAFDIEELGTALDAQSPPYSCPVCGSIAWNVWQDNTGLVSVALWGKQDGTSTGNGLPVLSLTCSTCGYLRQHQIGTFRAYLKRLKHESDSNQ